MCIRDSHYPAIDILQSISRCMSQIATREHKQAANKLKNVLATYNEAEDLINICLLYTSDVYKRQALRTGYQLLHPGATSRK